MNYVDQFLEKFQGVVTAGPDSWKALCPGHPDVQPSLAIRLTEEGKLLVRCHAGCDTEFLLSEAGLRLSDLFPPKGEPPVVGSEVSRAGGARAVDHATAAFRHEVYAELLEAMPLTARHRGELLKRGLPEAAVAENGYKSIEQTAAYRAARELHARYGDRLFAVPGFVHDEGGRPSLALSEGLLIPIRDHESYIIGFQVRTYDPSRKYVWLSSESARSGTPTHVPSLVSRWVGVDRPDTVRLTEGPLKADVVMALDPSVPTLGVPGAANWRSVLPVLEGMAVEKVILAFDADRKTNQAVGDQLNILHANLVEAGYRVEYQDWDTKDGKGLDDLLLAGKRPKAAVSPSDTPAGRRIGAGVVRRVLAGADPVVPQVQGTCLAPIEEALAGSPAVAVLGPQRLAAAARAVPRAWGTDPGDADAATQATDWGNARRLVRDHGQDLRFIHAWGKWLVWDGRRWLHDDTGEIARRAKETVRALAAEARACVDAARTRLKGLEEDDPGRTYLKADLRRARQDLQHAKRSASRARLEAMVVVASSEPGVAVRPEDLDRDPMLLNVRNGTLDLRTGELRPHRREDLLTKLVPVVYEPQAPCPTWLRFVGQITGGDASLADYLQRIAGYVLTGSTKEQVMFVFHGSGANGKSTFVNTLVALLGDYGMTASPDMLMQSRGERHPTELADLYGKRLVACTEVGQGRHLNESLVKQLTGSENVRARRMREDFWEFAPTHKIILSGNHKPVVRGGDDGIWRRLPLVPFRVQFSGKDKNPDLPDKLREELPGILAWALAGCRQWYQNGLQPPASVEQATRTYRQSMDPVAQFLDEECVLGLDQRARATDLVDRYRRWANQDPERSVSRGDLKESLEARGFDRKRSGVNGNWYWHGLSLRAREAAA